MARKTNYSFERNQRAKAKAAKREAKRQAKLAAKTDTKTVSEDEDGVAKDPSRDTAPAGKASANND